MAELGHPSRNTGAINCSTKTRRERQEIVEVWVLSGGHGMVSFARADQSSTANQSTFLSVLYWEWVYIVS